MTEILPFFILLASGIFFSEFFQRLHLPWVVALIICGFVIGPQGLNIITITPTIDFMSQIGLILVMFMAGLEVRVSEIKQAGKPVITTALINSSIPFFTALGIGFWLGFSTTTTLLLATIFISSSIAVIIPSLETNKLLHTRLGITILSATILEDVASLVMLSIIYQNIDPITQLPLPVFYLVLAGVLILLRLAIPYIKTLISKKFQHQPDPFQEELRTIFTLLIGTVIIFELIGLHPIIAGFFAGLVLSDYTQSETLKQKLRAISYGVFIPSFFIMVGSTTQFSSISGFSFPVLLIIGGSMLSKWGSGWLAGKVNGFSNHQSAFIGFATMPQLSTTLAVAFVAQDSGWMNPETVATLVVLSIITTLLSPIFINIFNDQSRTKLVSWLDHLALAKRWRHT